MAEKDAIFVGSVKVLNAVDRNRHRGYRGRLILPAAVDFPIPERAIEGTDDKHEIPGATVVDRHGVEGDIAVRAIRPQDIRHESRPYRLQDRDKVAIYARHRLPDVRLKHRSGFPKVLKY